MPEIRAHGALGGYSQLRAAVIVGLVVLRRGINLVPGPLPGVQPTRRRVWTQAVKPKLVPAEYVAVCRALRLELTEIDEFDVATDGEEAPAGPKEHVGTGLQREGEIRLRVFDRV